MESRPNILFINVDQQRYDSLGFTGHPIVKTPHLDSLAAKGVQFDSAFTPIPLCCPARQTLLTGVMPEQHGGLWNYDLGPPVPAASEASPVWVRQLADAGYNCGYLGKWHVNPNVDPTGFGFHFFDDPTPQRSSVTTKHTLSKRAWPQLPVGACDAVPLEETHTHLLAAHCNAAIDRLGEDGKPWHIRLDFQEPHLPCIPAEPFASMYPPAMIPPWENFNESFDGKPFIQQQQLRNWRIDDWGWEEWAVYLSGYFGIISQVDDAIGKVIRHLEASGLTRNTLIIYTTDHGDAAGSHRMMDKHYVMYEEEVHVPMVLRWDGTIEPGTVCHDFVSHYLDLPVTLLTLLGLPVPDNYQGRSFLPQLQGMKAENPWPVAFSTYSGQQFGLYSQRMIRDRRYKYIWNATDVDECYDLKTDPFEMKNLAVGGIREPLCAEYREKLWRVFSELRDPLVTGAWVQSSLLTDKDIPPV